MLRLLLIQFEPPTVPILEYCVQLRLLMLWPQFDDQNTHQLLEFDLAAIKDVPQSSQVSKSREHFRKNYGLR
jgi:hypothetical protein